jgi:hypothetical protein
MYFYLPKKMDIGLKNYRRALSNLKKLGTIVLKI